MNPFSFRKNVQSKLLAFFPLCKNYGTCPMVFCYCDQTIKIGFKWPWSSTTFHLNKDDIKQVASFEARFQNAMIFTDCNDVYDAIGFRTCDTAKFYKAPGYLCSARLCNEPLCHSACPLCCVLSLFAW